MTGDQQRDRYDAYLERRRRYLREWRKRNPGKVREYTRRAYEKMKEGGDNDRR